ncbi:hypothetical protein EJ08DRAFT_666413 [Tothia fuscella]|uniref:Uncharacterized protein n=1 Tax=Tothia fuscella TaxID=1048955 RepID=A0A9P4NEK4_9PEZI|nr:hypothetical protein EJ08DRAFT_666413 [Tothia fuscella]
MASSPRTPSSLASLNALPNELKVMVIKEIDKTKEGVRGLCSLRRVNKNFCSNVHESRKFFKLFKHITIHVNTQSIGILVNITNNLYLRHAVKKISVSIQCFGPHLLEYGRTHENWTQALERTVYDNMAGQQHFRLADGSGMDPVYPIAYCLTWLPNCRAVSITDTLSALYNKAEITKIVPSLLLYPNGNWLPGSDVQRPNTPPEFEHDLEHHRNAITTKVMNAIAMSPNPIHDFKIAYTRDVDYDELPAWLYLPPNLPYGTAHTAFANIRTLQLQVSINDDMVVNLAPFFSFMSLLSDLTLQFTWCGGRFEGENFNEILTSATIPQPKNLKLENVWFRCDLFLQFLGRHVHTLRSLYLMDCCLEDADGDDCREFFVALVRNLALQRLRVETLEGLGSEEFWRLSWGGSEEKEKGSAEGLGDIKSLVENIVETAEFKML